MSLARVLVLNFKAQNMRFSPHVLPLSEHLRWAVCFKEALICHGFVFDLSFDLTIL